MPRSNNAAAGAQAEGFGVYDFAVTDAEQVVARDDPPDDDQDTVNETGVSDQEAVAESSSNLSGAVSDVVTDNTGVVAASQLMDVLTGGDQAAAAGSPDFDIRDLVNDAEVDRVSDAFNKETDQQAQQAIVQDLMSRSEPAGISLITQRSAEGWGATEDGVATDGKTAEAFASWGAQVSDMEERYSKFSESVINPLRNMAESNLARVASNQPNRAARLLRPSPRQTRRYYYRKAGGCPTMTIAIAPEQAALLRLEQIQSEISAQLTLGAIAPAHRDDAARRVVALRQEAEAIAVNPRGCQPPEPWQIDNPQYRRQLTTLTVNTVFSAAPEDDVLTEALIAWWIQSLDETAGRREQKQYEKESRRMRADADSARRVLVSPCPYPLPPSPEDPYTFLTRMSDIIAQTRKSIAQNRKKPAEPWRRAACHALDELDASVGWLLHHTGPAQTRNGVAALAEQCLELAQKFNEIHYAAETR